jgi:uncharacterized hydrophobic protein (TIGR00271 family)
VGEQAQLSPLLVFACALAQEAKGAVTLLYVAPDGERPRWLQTPEQHGDVAIRVMTRTGEHVDAVILDAARDLRPDLLLMGWDGMPGQERYLLGSTLDPVTRYAPCDVAVMRTSDLSTIRRVLVPMSSGPNAPLALELALHLPDVQVTALNVARESLGATGEAVGRTQLDHVLRPWAGNDRVSTQVVRASGIIDGILTEAASDYDIVLIGATEASYVDRKLFGNVPQAVAADAPVPTVVVQHRTGTVKTLLRRAEWRISQIEDSLTTTEHAETYRKVRDGARAQPDFFVLIALAAVVATLGLLMNSSAVIIGAMVIAPFMASILGISLGVVHGDTRLLWDAAGTLLQGICLAILVGALLTLAVPGRELTEEVLGRTQPTLLDLGVALAAGAVAAYAQCRREAVDALSGVAIAVALAPPLTTVGIGIAMLDGRVTVGAFVLFLTNLSAIVAASSAVFLLFGFRPNPGSRFRVFSRSMIGVIVLLIVVSSVLTVLTVQSIRATRLDRDVREALVTEIRSMDGLAIDTWQLVENAGAGLRIEVQIQADREVSRQQGLELQRQLSERLQRSVELTLSVVPVKHLDLSE